VERAIADLYKAIRINSPAEIVKLLRMTLRALPVKSLMEIRAVAMKSTTLVLNPKSRYQDPPHWLFDNVCSFFEEDELCVLSSACRAWTQHIVNGHCGYTALLSRRMIDVDWFNGVAKHCLRPLLVCPTVARVTIPRAHQLHEFLLKVNTLTTISELRLFDHLASAIHPFVVLPQLDNLTHLRSLCLVAPYEQTFDVTPAVISSLAHLSRLHELHGVPMSILRPLLPICTQLRSIECISTTSDGAFPSQEGRPLQHLTNVRVLINRESRFSINDLHLAPQLQTLCLHWTIPRGANGPLWRPAELPPTLHLICNLKQLALKGMSWLDLTCLKSLKNLQTIHLHQVDQVVTYSLTPTIPGLLTESCIATLPTIVNLELTDCGFTDSWEFITCFPALRTLISVDCWPPRNTDALNHVKSTLTSLTVDWPHNDVLHFITCLPALRRLDLSAVDMWKRIFTEQLAAKKRTMAQLTHLTLPDCSLNCMYGWQRSLFPRSLDVQFA
jgi:hypothetical protein